LPHASDAERLVGEIQAVHRRICAAQRELFGLLAEADRCELWRGSGARDMTQWVSITQGISAWKAARWVAAARALGSLPALSEAMGRGVLGVDKVVELARFACLETEDGLVAWAQRVSTWAVRRRADLEVRRSADEVRDLERSRSLSWWYFDEGRRFGLEAELPAAEGAVVARAIERAAARVPVMPDETGEAFADARRADALVTLASGGSSGDGHAERPTVVVHALAEVLERDEGSCEIEGGGIVPVQSTRRLLCHARIQALVQDEHGHPVRVGRLRRDPPGWMVRQLRYRDRECTFPGCGARRFTQAHHIVWWEHGGATDLENLVLVCGYHHKLVHEFDWSVRREQDGARWFRPDGTAFRTGVDPPAIEVA